MKNSLTKPFLDERLDFLLEMIKSCEGCFRTCHLDRYQTNKTYCRTGIQPVLYFFSKIDDSIFFSKKKLLYLYFQHCNLRCVYCIDYELHQGQSIEEKRITLKEYANLLKENIDQTTKAIYFTNVDHIIPHTLYALHQLLLEDALIPIIFESNGFALHTTVHYLRDLVTIYIHNFKFITPELARLYLKEENYPQIAKDTLKEMYNQVGDCVIDKNFIQKGLIVKLLILPGFVEEYKQILNFIASISLKIGVFIEANYVPSGKVLKQELYKNIKRNTSEKEILNVYEYAKELNFYYIKIL